MLENIDSVQLLNTAIVKSREKKIDISYEDRLSEVCQSPAIHSLGVAIKNLSETQKISRDEAAIQIVDSIRNLDSIWHDYVLMEGMSKLKDMLNTESIH